MTDPTNQASKTLGIQQEGMTIENSPSTVKIENSNSKSTEKPAGQMEDEVSKPTKKKKPSLPNFECEQHGYMIIGCSSDIATSELYCDKCIQELVTRAKNKMPLISSLRKEEESYLNIGHLLKELPSLYQTVSQQLANIDEGELQEVKKPLERKDDYLSEFDKYLQEQYGKIDNYFEELTSKIIDSINKRKEELKKKYSDLKKDLEKNFIVYEKQLENLTKKEEKEAPTIESLYLKANECEDLDEFKSVIMNLKGERLKLADAIANPENSMLDLKGVIKIIESKCKTKKEFKTFFYEPLLQSLEDFLPQIDCEQENKPSLRPGKQLKSSSPIPTNSFQPSQIASVTMNFHQPVPHFQPPLQASMLTHQNITPNLSSPTVQLISTQAIKSSISSQAPIFNPSDIGLPLETPSLSGTLPQKSTLETVAQPSGVKKQGPTSIFGTFIPIPMKLTGLSGTLPDPTLHKAQGNGDKF